MHGELEPIGAHEGVELAEITNYYIDRNLDAVKLFNQCDRFPTIENSDGHPIIHYETMVIRSVQRVGSQATDNRRVRLYPALPMNGASADAELAPIEVTLLGGVEVRGGFIALIQRMNETGDIAAVFFVSDDSSSSVEQAS